MKRVLAALAIAKIAGERPQGHPVHFGRTRPIRALDIDRKTRLRTPMCQRQVRVEVLLRAKLEFEIVLLGELHEHREEQQFQHLRNDLRIDRDRIDAPIDIDEAFDDPIALIRRHRLRK